MWSGKKLKVTVKKATYLVKFSFYLRLPFDSQNIEMHSEPHQTQTFNGDLSPTRHSSQSEVTLASIHTLSSSPNAVHTNLTSNKSHFHTERGGNKEKLKHTSYTAFTSSQTR